MFQALLEKLQAFVRTDKAVISAVVVQAAMALAAAMKFHVSAEGVAVLTAIVSIGLGYFLQQHFNAKLAAAKH
jgi:hypothetical protein